MLTSFVAATPSRSKNFNRFAVFAVVISLFVAGAPFAAQATTFTIFGPFPSITTTYGIGSIPIVPPTTNSPAPWVITSSNPKVATISGKTINVVGAGYATITASQAAIGSFTARSRMTYIRVNQGTPTIGSFAPQSISITQKTYTIAPPTSNSDGNWGFISSNPSVASIVGTTVTTHNGGSTQIYATQSGTSNWKSAGVSMTFTVLTIAPVIGAFGDISIMKDSISSLTLNPPTSTSPGLWSFVSSNPTVASIDRNVVTPHAFGKTVITATQNAVGDYGSTTASMTFTVQGPTPVVGQFPDVTANLSTSTSSSVALSTPTSTSTGAWTFTSSDTGIATINGLVITLLKAGAATITAMQAATSTYASPTPLTMTLRIVGNPTVGLWSGLQKVVNDPDFTLAPPTSNSDGAWSFTSSDPSVIEIANGVAKVKGAGKATIAGTQAATSVWTQATASMSIQVFGHIPTLGTFAPITATMGDSPKVITPPTSNSLGTWTYVSSNAKVAKVDGSSLVIIGSGSATISATQNSAGAYSQSNVVQTTLTVKPKPTPTPSATPKPTPTPTAKPTSIPTPTAKPTPTRTQTATKPPVNATIKVSASGRVLTVVAIGVKALVFINGKPGKVGKNSVKPGTASVVITIDDKVVYRRVFSIK